MFNPAELPLNDRGAVYHLDLLPEEIADHIITVGDPGRVKEISKYFDSIEVSRFHREFLTHTGYLNGKRISVISTGMGPPCIDIVMNELDALVNIDFKNRKPLDKTRSLTIIRIGTTGSIQKDIAPGDILLNSYAIGFDTLMSYYDHTISPNIKNLQQQFDNHLQGKSSEFYVTECCPILKKQFEKLGHIGITATCGGFYAPQNRQLRIPLKYPNFMETLANFNFEGVAITNFEMETSSIYALGQTLGHRCLSLNAVIANRITGHFITDISKVINKLIQETLAIDIEKRA
jgi:uridine phosphorylase